MRRDGTEFPVELTITRIALPGPPTFTGYLRDITERVRPSRSCAPRGRASSRWPTRSAGGSSATSTTARSSGSPRCSSDLGRIRASAGRARDRCSTLAIDELAAGLEEIRELASGLHPVRAHRARASSRRSRRSRMRAPAAGRAAALPDRRLPEPVEAAAYYVVAEALANVHKHAGARRVVVRATIEASTSTSRWPTTASAGPTRTGSGLRGLADPPADRYRYATGEPPSRPRAPRPLDAARAGDHLDRPYAPRPHRLDARSRGRRPGDVRSRAHPSAHGGCGQGAQLPADRRAAHLHRHPAPASPPGRLVRRVAVEPAARTSHGQPEDEFAAREVYAAIAACPSPTATSSPRSTSRG